MSELVDYGKFLISDLCYVHFLRAYQYLRATRPSTSPPSLIAHIISLYSLKKGEDAIPVSFKVSSEKLKKIIDNLERFLTTSLLQVNTAIDHGIESKQKNIESLYKPRRLLNLYCGCFHLWFKNSPKLALEFFDKNNKKGLSSRVNSFMYHLWIKYDKAQAYFRLKNYPDSRQSYKDALSMATGSQGKIFPYTRAIIPIIKERLAQIDKEYKKEASTSIPAKAAAFFSSSPSEPGAPTAVSANSGQDHFNPADYQSEPGAPSAVSASPNQKHFNPSKSPG